MPHYMPQVILATFRISSKPERADEHDPTSGFSSPGLSKDIHSLKELSVAMENRVLIRSGPNPYVVFPPPQ